MRKWTKAIPYKIVPKNVKYLGIKLIKYEQAYTIKTIENFRKN